MFLRALNWLLKLAGLSLHAKAEKEDLPRLNAPGDNVIEVDFSRGTDMQRISVQPIEDDGAVDTLYLHLVIPPRVHARMNAIKRISGVESHIETIRRALSTYDMLLELQAQGKDIGFYDQPGNWVEINMNFD